MNFSFFSKLKYEILIFSFLIAKIVFLPSNLGTVLPFISAVFLSVFLAWIVGIFIRSVDEKFKKTVLIFIVFFLGSAVSNSVLFLNSFEKQRLIYLNVFLVFCLIVAFASACKRQDIWRIPVICFVCIVIEPLFAFIYLPAIIILLLYQLYSSGFSGQIKWISAASVIAAAAAFVLLRKSFVFADNLSIATLIETNWKNIAYSFAIILPLIIIFTVIWASTIKNSKDKMFKLIVILIMLEPIFPVLALTLNRNFFDAVMPAIFVQFCFLAYFLYLKNPAFLDVFNRIVKIFEKNLLNVMLILIYLSAFSISTYSQQIGTWFSS